MKKTKNVVWGIVLVAVGVVFALKALNIFSFDIFFDGWWTLFIIIPCLVGLFTESDKGGNAIGLVIGVALLLGCQGVVNFSLLWKLLIPAVIVAVGIRLIFGGIFGTKISKAIADISVDKNQAGYRTSFAVFGGNTITVDSEPFVGAELTAVFGGVKCDLRNAVIENDCVINVSAVFGGIDILAPDTVNVQIKSTSLFGGMSNKTPVRQGVPTVYVSGVCMFGGVDVK